ncbi:hypothetical protein DCS_02030 [Drechmeria coniospora]|uniref:2EXR domain-containing protein n=1 Tax=Drechmeria coniospora TaxID=98403 RepID=A0A151GUZ4_DRECN|nr:hypothetical protein DCS_02030 [Drechmeria coniospora]KYK60891.1 hypothetical protein DCS_02030 [Drechmeria coniospora]ODA83587.1 hypothetical protein RJ55_02102 [Drechmeria coniospora]
MATFHPFPHLFPELRAHIWRLTADPRLVSIRVRKTATSDLAAKRYQYASPTPPPAVMHVCQESRKLALYQEAFVAGGSNVPRSYIWVNFEEDMICLEDDSVEWLSPHDTDIRRLRFTVPRGDLGATFYEYFAHRSHEMLERFTALRALHLAIGENILLWGSTVCGPGYGACPRENVRFEDLKTGLLLTGPQLEMTYSWSELDGGRVQDMEDFDDELQFMLDNDTGLDLSTYAKMD